MLVRLTIPCESRSSEVFELDAHELSIGADSGADVFIDPRLNEGITGKQARLTLIDGRWLVERTGNSSFAVNRSDVGAVLSIRSAHRNDWSFRRDPPARSRVALDVSWSDR